MKVYRMPHYVNISFLFYFIDLHTSKLSTFVLELSKLSNLEQLTLDGSLIDKSLLRKIGVMTSLNGLSMRNCGLNGTLPDRGRVFFFFFFTMILLQIITIVEPNN